MIKSYLITIPTYIIIIAWGNPYWCAEVQLILLTNKINYKIPTLSIYVKNNTGSID